MDRMNATIKDIQTKAKRLWDENPMLCIVLGIAGANASAKLMSANSQRRNSKAWSREVKRREKSDKKK